MKYRLLKVLFRQTNASCIAICRQILTPCDTVLKITENLLPLVISCFLANCLPFFSLVPYAMSSVLPSSILFHAVISEIVN